MKVDELHPLTNPKRRRTAIRPVVFWLLLPISIHFILPPAPETALANDANYSSLDQALASASKASNLSEFTSACKFILAACNSDTQEFAVKFSDFSEYYAGRSDEQKIPKSAAQHAKVLMWAAGFCKKKKLIKAVHTKRSPAFVTYAYAESAGIKLHYAFTEGCELDCVVDHDAATSILKVNGLLD